MVGKEIICAQLVRDVEVCSLNTASRVEGLWHEQARLAAPVYDIHAHAFVRPDEAFELTEFENVIFTTHRSWKVLTQEDRYIEDVGYTSNTGLHGIEFWPDFCGRCHIRSNAPVVRGEFGPQAPFLLGYDGAYYHWVLNWLPRLMAFDLFPSRLGPLRAAKILTGPLPPICRESLLKFGVAPENIIELDDLANYQVPRLIVPSFMSNSRVSANVSAWYRSKVVDRHPGPSDKRIYISRSDALQSGKPRRQVVNEAEVIEALATRGFQPHVLSSYTFEQQVELFTGAECVVAPHGAGLVNMVFSTPGTPAVVFENSYRHTFMKEALDVLGHRATILDCSDVLSVDDEERYLAEGVDEGEIRRNRNMQVTPDSLLALVDGLLT